MHGDRCLLSFGIYSYVRVSAQYRTLSNTTYGKKIISILKNVRFSGKGRQSLHVIRICKNRISYVRLDHTLYSINYGTIYIIVLKTNPIATILDSTSNSIIIIIANGLDTV